jgi:pimeloyl-ACP methyl ester carboxylesterase
VVEPCDLIGGEQRTVALTPHDRERAHLAGPEIGVDTHVRDILAVLEYEDLHDVILVGHSYAGTVVTAAAEQAAERLARLVYVDAFVPADGDTTFDFFPREQRESLRAAAQAHGDGWRIPAGDEILDIWAISDPAQRDWVRPRLTPFPLRCFEQPVKLPRDAAATLRRSYIGCAAGPTTGLFAQFVDLARRDRWDLHHLDTGHAAWVTASDELASLLLQLPKEA